MRAIADTFARIRQSGKPGLVAYITAGDPDLPRTAEILQSIASAGADVIEVGVPFSDPLADGPVIQRAAERALKAGATLRKTLDTIGAVRPQIGAPIVLFTYANPILKMGPEAFAAAARKAGVDGVLVLDLPVEESGAFRQTLVNAELDPIFLLSPTTSNDRIDQAATLGRGFLYVISRLGVTGARSDIPVDAEALVRRIRARSDLPLALGFGLSRPEHVAQVGQWADAAVVGSALVNVIAEHGTSPDVAARAGEFVRWLKGGTA